MEPTNKVDDEVMGLINDSIENDSLLQHDLAHRKICFYFTQGIIRPPAVAFI